MDRLFAPHPMNDNVAWATCFYVEPISDKVFLLHDATTSGMSVTNNMESVLSTICHHYRIWEDHLSRDYTIYTVEDGAVYKVGHEHCTNPTWTYMGPDDKAIRVLYGK